MLGARVYLAAEGAETEDFVDEFPAAHQACASGAEAHDGALWRLRPRVYITLSWLTTYGCTRDMSATSSSSATRITTLFLYDDRRICNNIHQSITPPLPLLRT